MSGLELNKIIGGILVAALVGMISGKIADALYKPEVTIAKRGYQIAVEEEVSPAPGGAPAEEVAMDVNGLLAKANPENGKNVMKKCASCHDVSKGGVNKVGPELYGVVGRKKGSNPGFTYSDGMMAKGGTWQYEDLFHFIHNPKKFVPNTKMSFAGIKKPEDIADLVAYLRTMSDNPMPLPK